MIKKIDIFELVKLWIGNFTRLNIHVFYLQLLTKC